MLRQGALKKVCERQLAPVRTYTVTVRDWEVRCAADSKTLQIQGLTLADSVTFTVWPHSHVNLSQQQARAPPRPWPPRCPSCVGTQQPQPPASPVCLRRCPAEWDTSAAALHGGPAAAPFSS